MAPSCPLTVCQTQPSHHIPVKPFPVPPPVQALPRRRVSVAVVPKFNLLNIPGQTPATSPISGSGAGPTPGAALPVVVGLPVRMQNDTASVFKKNNIDDALVN